MPRELQLRIASGVAVARCRAGDASIGGRCRSRFLLGAIAAAMSWEWGRIVRGDAATTSLPRCISRRIGDGGGLAAFGMAGLALAAVAIGAITAAALAVGSGRTALTGAGVALHRPAGHRARMAAQRWFAWAAGSVVCVAGRRCDRYGGLFHGARHLADRNFGRRFRRIRHGRGWSAASRQRRLPARCFPYVTGSGSSVWLARLGLVLGLVAQGGDLAESALKRHFGRKDASDLIPGHGGFMDRMDGIVTASVAAALIALAS